jgi:alpha-1,2-glucosyltransferase
VHDFANIIFLKSGVLAVLFRQTNIIWVFFAVAVSIIQNFEKDREITNASNPLNFINYIMKNITSICSKYALFILIGLMFIVFAIWNKGIVVGKILLIVLGLK